MKIEFHSLKNYPSRRRQLAQLSKILILMKCSSAWTFCVSYASKTFSIALFIPNGMYINILIDVLFPETTGILAWESGRIDWMGAHKSDRIIESLKNKFQ